MTPDQFEQAKFVVETHREIHEERKRKEFRIVITTLSFYVASVAAVLSGKINPVSPARTTFAIATILAFVGIALAAFIQFFYSALANEVTQKKIAEPAEDLVLESLDIKPPKDNPMRFAWLWQAAAIAAGALLASWIIWAQFLLS